MTILSDVARIGCGGQTNESACEAEVIKDAALKQAIADESQCDGINTGVTAQTCADAGDVSAALTAAVDSYVRSAGSFDGVPVPEDDEETGSAGGQAERLGGRRGPPTGPAGNRHEIIVQANLRTPSYIEDYAEGGFDHYEFAVKYRYVLHWRDTIMATKFGAGLGGSVAVKSVGSGREKETLASGMFSVPVEVVPVAVDFSVGDWKITPGLFVGTRLVTLNGIKTGGESGDIGWSMFHKVDITGGLDLAITAGQFVFGGQLGFLAFWEKGEEEGMRYTIQANSYDPIIMHAALFIGGTFE